MEPTLALQSRIRVCAYLYFAVLPWTLNQALVSSVFHHPILPLNKELRADLSVLSLTLQFILEVCWLCSNWVNHRLMTDNFFTWKQLAFAQSTVVVAWSLLQHPTFLWAVPKVVLDARFKSNWKQLVSFRFLLLMSYIVTWTCNSKLAWWRLANFKMVWTVFRHSQHFGWTLQWSATLLTLLKPKIEFLQLLSKTHVRADDRSSFPDEVKSIPVAHLMFFHKVGHYTASTSRNSSKAVDS